MKGKERYDALASSFKRETKCKCPRCGRYHFRFMEWTGRGIPRKFCGSGNGCAVTVGIYGYRQDSEHSVHL